MPWGVAAAAVAAGGSYMSSKNANKGNKRPSYMTEGENYAVDRARNIAERPFQAYTGQRVAGMSGNEQQASELARSGTDKATGFMDQAGSELGKISDFSGEEIDKYTNPFIERVLSPQLRVANEEYDRNRASLLNSKAGALGGDRAAFQESELTRNHLNNVSDLTGKTYAEAFESAKSSFFQDQDRHMRASQAYQSLGGDVSRMNTQQIQDLMATGGVDRLLKQADLDFDFSEFARAQGWDTQNLQPLLDALGTGQGGERNRPAESSPWGAALGAAATVAGAYFTGGGNLGKKTGTDNATGGIGVSGRGYDG